MKKLFLGTTLVVGLALALGLSACKQASISRESGQQTVTIPTQAPIEKKTAEYQVIVTVPNPPLKSQIETYRLQVHDLKANKPVETPPEVKVEMPMGNTPMLAPTTISKGASPGEFLLKTEFTMPGNWTIQVKPVQSVQIITLTLSVQ